MRNKKLLLFFIVIVIFCAIGLYAKQIRQKKASVEEISEITPFIGPVKNYISSTGTVLPKNRLEIKPPVNGRIEQILAQEGDKVKSGQILAWMSSTERAALLDAARGKDEKILQYWQEVYKSIPLSAPIDGEVIVAKIQPGQTVVVNDAVLVLSDWLIVRAQIDETDIGKITSDKKAVVSLDAYPDTKINASVAHIYYESKTVNNVTIYEVDLILEEIPPFFRSGMNATIDFIERGKENALLIPVDAVHKENAETYVLVKQGNGQQPRKTRVLLGISDDKNVEVLSGIAQNDKIILKAKKYSLPKSAQGSNPFMPSHRR